MCFVGVATCKYRTRWIGVQRCVLLGWQHVNIEPGGLVFKNVGCWVATSKYRTRWIGVLKMLLVAVATCKYRTRWIGVLKMWLVGMATCKYRTSWIGVQRFGLLGWQHVNIEQGGLVFEDVACWGGNM
jgi:hypothetical protein